jgi:hypothetical protein
LKVLTQAAILTEVWAEARALRQRFTAFATDIAAGDRSADVVAAAIARHLAATTTGKLPPAAELVWRERLARPLKADATKPLPPRAIAAMRSWPSSRIEDLVQALSEIEAILVDAENEAHNEVIYAEISRAYS